MNKIIYIIIFLIIVSISGYFLFPEKVYDTETCNAACIEQCKSCQAVCEPSSSENSEALIFGACVNEDDTCGKDQHCNCYCRQLIGGCAGVHPDNIQECCDNWALENDVVHIQCVGKWEVKQGLCEWICS